MWNVLFVLSHRERGAQQPTWSCHRLAKLYSVVGALIPPCAAYVHVVASTSIGAALFLGHGMPRLAGIVAMLS